ASFILCLHAFGIGDFHSKRFVDESMDGAAAAAKFGSGFTREVLQRSQSDSTSSAHAARIRAYFCGPGRNVLYHPATFASFPTERSRDRRRAPKQVERAGRGSRRNNTATAAGFY